MVNFVRGSVAWSISVSRYTCLVHFEVFFRLEVRHILDKWSAVCSYKRENVWRIQTLGDVRRRVPVQSAGRCRRMASVRSGWRVSFAGWCSCSWRRRPLRVRLQRLQGDVSSAMTATLDVDSPNCCCCCCCCCERATTNWRRSLSSSAGVSSDERGNSGTTPARTGRFHSSQSVVYEMAVLMCLHRLTTV